MKPSLQGLPYLAVATMIGCSEAPPPAAPQAAPAAVSAATVDIGPAIRKALGGDLEAHYFDAAVDLNGDGRREVVALVAGPMVCGSGGCPAFVLAPGPEGYRLVTSLAVVQGPIQVSPRSSQGWRNLVVGIGGGGMPAGNAELKYDGRGYPENPNVPPAEPAPSLEGTEMLIPRFESYKDGKPVPPAAASAPAVYGDAKTPVAGKVLGTTIHTEDAEELRYVILRQLTDRYAAGQGIEVTQVEKDAYNSKVRETMKLDRERAQARRDELVRRLAATDLPEAERKSIASELETANRTLSALAEVEGNPDEIKAAKDEIAAAFIRQWKINGALYKQYGGRIIFQQAGPEPLDAYRKFLEEAQARGDYEILNKDLEAAFWRYYRTDAIHSFYKPGSRDEAQAFESPPWLSK